MNNRKLPGQYLIESGLLAEINRTIMHPLGLALFIESPEMGKEDSVPSDRVLCVIKENCDVDYCFHDQVIDKTKECIRFLLDEKKEHIQKRRETLGYVVQGVNAEQLAVDAFTEYDLSIRREEPSSPEDGRLVFYHRTRWVEMVKKLLGLGGL